MAEAEHLKLIQAVIARMAGNSFLVKGWTVTLVAALSAFAKAQTETTFAWIAAGVVVAFALLDAFYLALERAYRDLYDRAAKDAPGVTPWTLDAGEVGPSQVARAFTGFAVWPLYTVALAAALAIALTT